VSRTLVASELSHRSTFRFHRQREEAAGHEIGLARPMTMTCFGAHASSPRRPRRIEELVSLSESKGAGGVASSRPRVRRAVRSLALHVPAEHEVVAKTSLPSTLTVRLNRFLGPGVVLVLGERRQPDVVDRRHARLLRRHYGIDCGAARSVVNTTSLFDD
jgi:hypothetical protein